MTSSSRIYEEIAASIKEALDTRPDVRIEPHVRVRDAITGRMRDIDVLIETTVTGTPLRIGVECRRRNRAVDSPQIEAFVTKIRDCQIDKGVFVSASGFTDEALAVAGHYGIVCCHLTNVSELPWFSLLLARSLAVMNIKFYGDMQLKTVGGLPDRDSIVVFPEGFPPPLPLTDLARQIILIQDFPPGHHRRRIVYEPKNRPVAITDGKSPVPIARVEIEAEFDIVEIEPKIEHWLYAREGEGPSAGMTRVDFGEFNGKPLTLEITSTNDPTSSDDKSTPH